MLRSNRKAANLATFYFKHIDTDSDKEKVTKMAEENEIPNVQSSGEDTTDNEWTYAVNKNDGNLTEQSEDVTEKPSIKQIYRLVEKADELLRESPKKCDAIDDTPINKISRVKQWLNMDKPDDSCDASCEDDEKDSESSEELNESIATCRVNAWNDTLNSSCIDLEDTSTPKVPMRSGRSNAKRNSNRPWSVSCISQLSSQTVGMTSDAPIFSISESALNKLALTPKNLKHFNHSSNSIGALCNSTSSTVEESTAIIQEEKCSVVKRRKLKLKKKVSTL